MPPRPKIKKPVKKPLKAMLNSETVWILYNPKFDRLELQNQAQNKIKVDKWSYKEIFFQIVGKEVSFIGRNSYTVSPLRSTGVMVTASGRSTSPLTTYSRKACIRRREVKPLRAWPSSKSWRRCRSAARLC